MNFFSLLLVFLPWFFIYFFCLDSTFHPELYIYTCIFVLLIESENTHFFIGLLPKNNLHILLIEWEDQITRPSSWHTRACWPTSQGRGQSKDHDPWPGTVKAILGRGGWSCGIEESYSRKCGSLEHKVSIFSI